jgi:RNase adaptor protein for sRNA GlmZ degradation
MYKQSILMPNTLLTFFPFGYNFPNYTYYTESADLLIDVRYAQDPPTKEDIETASNQLDTYLSTLSVPRPLKIAIGCDHGRSRSKQIVESLREKYGA